ncbi:hypothetical protein SYNPS1DRAFT_22005 [Syncephalis pseudoplumigaleata]|uniref:Uncharacterized protein n=1 Tax=Syncephalis pseudoplumigaleata TaxID=1712513 RepID=A0A4P9Z1C9_9FUNG|nr:hypothetical protein SYNPS1DRAFT_22005 [Syncephalis pseudoplumigaleata]|eukprot:RKP26176.1 hypothetical protein SYNPS1DRAFT_22005 [Syncephalis pseudoplumigaleata]
MLVHKVTRTEFEEALGRNDDVWRAFQRYAARDLCAESVCFIEAYRKLMAQVDAHKQSLLRPQRRRSRKYSEHDGASTLDGESSGYAQRVLQRLRSFTFDSITANSTDHEMNQLACVHGGEPATLGMSPSTSRVMPTAIPEHGPSASRESSTSHEASSSSRHEESTLSGGCGSFDASGPLPDPLVPAYRALFETYVREGATLQLNITHAAKAQATSRVREHHYTFNMFDAIYTEVKWSLWTNTFPRFIETYRQDLSSTQESPA